MICTYANNLLGRVVFHDARTDFSPTIGDNHILHIVKETVFKALFTFLEKNKMYTERGKQWREVEKFTEEKIRKNYKKAAKRLWHIWQMWHMWCGHNNKGWHMNTGVVVTYTYALQFRCDTDALHFEDAIMWEAIFEMHTTCRTSEAPADGKFWFWGTVWLQVSDESTSSRFNSPMMS